MRLSGWILGGLLCFASATAVTGLTPSEREERVFDRMEETVFTPTNAAEVRALTLSNGGPEALFRNALVNYRVGTMVSNVEPVRDGIRQMEELLSNGVTNAHVMTYYAILYSAITVLSPNIFEKLPALNRSFDLLDRAVGLYPDHYLPRFFRATLKLLVPGIVGGNETVGRSDMDWVIGRMDSIRRNGNYKAMMYFFYAVYWAERKNDYDRALECLAFAGRYAESRESKDNIRKHVEIYLEKRG